MPLLFVPIRHISCDCRKRRPIPKDITLFSEKLSIKDFIFVPLIVQCHDPRSVKNFFIPSISSPSGFFLDFTHIYVCLTLNCQAFITFIPSTNNDDGTHSARTHPSGSAILFTGRLHISSVVIVE